MPKILTSEEKFKRFRATFPTQDEQFRDFLVKYHQFKEIEKGLLKEMGEISQNGE